MTTDFAKATVKTAQDSMEAYVRNYQRSALHITALATDDKFPTALEITDLMKVTELAKGASKVLLVLEAYEYGRLIEIIPRLRHHLNRAISDPSKTAQFLKPISEAVRFFEAEERKLNALANAEADPDAICGDYPAPCNCDDPETHNGH